MPEFPIIGLTQAGRAAKSLSQMTAEVLEWCQAKGWYDKPVSFGEAMALLHSEVSEALEAWRLWGTMDATRLDRSRGKPEGAGSEFADILIRLLDDCARFGCDLALQVSDLDWRPEDASTGSFGEKMDDLHILIARASELHLRGSDGWRVAFADILILLQALCERYGVDLAAEYERKMAYNRTRPWRHGNKRQ